MWTQAQSSRRADEIVELDRRRRETAAEECTLLVEIATRLVKAKANLPRGAFDRWVRDRLPFGRATAYRLLKFAAAPRALLDFFPLGRCAVFQLMRLPAEVLRTLKPDQVVDGLRLNDMPVRTLRRVVDGLLKLPRPAPSAAARARSYVNGLRRLQQTDPAAFESVRAELLLLSGHRCSPTAFIARRGA